jgi:hypothetical protein
MIFSMKRQILLRALTFGISASAFIFTSCSTTETRISEHPEIFQSLSPRDQALVREGKIREGMSQNAVWVAWGAPDLWRHGYTTITPTRMRLIPIHMARMDTADTSVVASFSTIMAIIASPLLEILSSIHFTTRTFRRVWLIRPRRYLL